MKNTIKNITITLLFAFSMMAAATETRTFDVSSEANLELSNVAGDITITSGSNDRIEVNFDNPDDEIEVIFDQEGDTLKVHVEYPRNYRSKNKGVSFEVSFPSEGNLEINSVSGNVKVMSIDGTHRLKSVSGDVTVDNMSGEMELNSVSGDVKMNDMGNASIDAASISGDVLYENGSLGGGPYDFASTSGNVTLNPWPTNRKRTMSASPMRSSAS